MKYILLILILSFTLLTSATKVNALTRDDLVLNVRSGSGITTVTNIVTNVIHLGGSQTGNIASNGTSSLQSIQDAINRIQQLRNSLRLR